MRRIPVLAGIAALAMPSLAPAQVLPPTLELTYTTYAAGFTTLRLIVDFSLTPKGYRVSLAYRTVGAVGFFLPGHDDASAEGSWSGNAAHPEEFESDGMWRGQPYDVVMDYPDGAPEVERLYPAQTRTREAVPAALREGTIDTASAMALLLHRMVEGGSCDLSERVFDGRRLMVLAAQPAGTEALGPTVRSFFHGPAIRCDITGRLLAGFLRTDDAAERQRVRHGAVWFAHPIPGLPLLPVRIAFDNRWFGAATMYLTDVTAGPREPPVAPAALALAPPATDPPPAPAGH
jgi:hypothetical protein